LPGLKKDLLDDIFFGHHGFVTDLVKPILESGVGVNEAVVIGPLPIGKKKMGTGLFFFSNPVTFL